MSRYCHEIPQNRFWATAIQDTKIAPIRPYSTDNEMDRKLILC
jgi:hypothetical protein